MSHETDGMAAGQLLIVGFEGTRAPEDLLARIATRRAGGVILFKRNLGTPEEIAALVADIAHAAPPGPPIIVSVDQEGGRVQRLRKPLTEWPPMLRLAARDDLAMTKRVARALGEELRLFGFNLDYAPVCDINTNAHNPVIGDRAFGATAEQVERHALAFLRGLEAAGVRGCAKHFPGHGDTSEDSHLALPRVDQPMERLRRVELAPFRAAVHAGVSMIMTAHILLPALDARPATMSPPWIEGVLRGELGYRGVVVSDDLDMKAMADHYSVEETVEAGLAAGVDAYLCCREPERQRRAEDALMRASGDAVLGPRVAQSLARLDAFRRTLSAPVPCSRARIEAALPDADHQALADLI